VTDAVNLICINKKTIDRDFHLLKRFILLSSGRRQARMQTVSVEASQPSPHRQRQVCEEFQVNDIKKRSENDRRTGVDRRKFDNPNYNGPERRKSGVRRSGSDRRNTAD